MSNQARTCSKCGEVLPIEAFRGNRSACRKCEAAASRAYKAQNPEKTRASMQAWRAANTDHMREYNRRYRNEHVERAREVKRNWHRKNADRINRTLRERYRFNINGRRDRARAYRATHAEHYRNRVRAWRAANIEQARERERASRERTKARRSIYGRLRNAFYRERVREGERAYRRRNPVKHRINEQKRRARKAAVGGTYTVREWQALCEWFGNVCLCCGASRVLTADHVIPLAQGGANDIANIQPLCGSCNSRKHAKTIDYRDPAMLAAFLAELKK